MPDEAVAVAMNHSRPHRKKRDWRGVVFQICLLLPAVVFLGLFLYYPIEETFRLSLMRTQGFSDAVYIGFQNYARLFASDEFRQGFIHVFVWAFWSVVIQIPLAFFIAFTMTAFRNKVTGNLRAIYYMASIIPSAIVAMLGRFIFSPRNGIISSLATILHWTWLGSIDFFGDPKLAFWSVFTVATWAYTGFNIVYLMANIEQIPIEIREAAQLDGATRWQYARYVVIPMVSYPLRICAILCTVGSVKLFDLPWLLTSGGPIYATNTLSITLYKQGFVNSLYGKAAAVGVVIFLLSLIFAVAQFSLQRKEGGAE